MERDNSILYFSGSFDFKSRQWFKGVNTDAKKKKNAFGMHIVFLLKHTGWPECQKVSVHTSGPRAVKCQK